jgi:hypothetical protein
LEVSQGIAPKAERETGERGFEMQRKKNLDLHITPVFLCSLFLLFSVPRFARGGDELNRSFYVPVQIELCEHLSQAVLYRGEEPIRPLPGKQVFQFTYYPSMHRLVPETEHLFIKATREDGGPFQIELVVTSSAVYIGNKCIHLDLHRQLGRLRTRVDVHYEPVILKIACSKSCTRFLKEPKKVALKK